MTLDPVHTISEVDDDRQYDVDKVFVGRRERVTPTGPTMRFNGVMVQQHGPHHKTINQAYKPQSPYVTSGKLTKVGQTLYMSV